MSDHFLADFVSGEQPGFIAGSTYNAHGDCIQVLLADEAVVANRVDDVLTIYESAVDRRPIGYKIKAVSALVRKYGADTLLVTDESHDTTVERISVYALLLAAYEDGARTIKRRADYARALSIPNPSQTIDADELVPA